MTAADEYPQPPVRIENMPLNPFRSLIEKSSAALQRLMGRPMPAPDAELPDIAPEDMEFLHSVDGLTMTGIERRYALLESVRHIVREGIPGSIVECGVWRGGSMMLVLAELQRSNAALRDVYLYDTFTGMPAPSDRDVSWSGQSATILLNGDKRGKEASEMWAMAPLEEVRHNLAQTRYPASHIHLVPGKVEETLSVKRPQSISLLRLDTDWYESTKLELEVLYPLLARGGILIVDDYGHWKGARQAVDEFFAGLSPRPLLQRIDYTARLAIKP